MASASDRVRTLPLLSICHHGWTQKRAESNNTNHKEPCGQSQQHLNNNDTKQSLCTQHIQPKIQKQNFPNDPTCPNNNQELIVFLHINLPRISQASS